MASKELFTLIFLILHHTDKNVTKLACRQKVVRVKEYTAGPWGGLKIRGVSNVISIICPPHSVLKWDFTRTFPGNQDATLK